MYVIYNILIVIAGIVAFPYFLVKLLTSRRHRCGIKERLGFITIGEKIGRRFWVHASSVGEVNVAYPFINELFRVYGDLEVVLTAMTPEGYALAKEKFSDSVKVYYFCLDYRSCVNRFIDHVDPDAVFILETEIWPNLLRALRRKGVKTGMVNGRISERSFTGYKKVKGFIRSVLSNVDLFLVQQESYKSRIVALTGTGDNIEVTGNIKFDIDDSFFEVDAELTEWLRGISYIVAASTHEGEEMRILSILPAIKEAAPDIKLALVPRHIKRCADIEKLIEERGFSYIKRSELNGAKSAGEHDIILVDTIGDLVTFFQSAKLVFMGGSLTDDGGHNVLEPSFFALPVIFGPYMQNFTQAKRLLLEASGAVQVRDVEELREKIIDLLNDGNKMSELGQNAKSALQRNRGALKATIDAIRSRLDI